MDIFFSQVVNHGARNALRRRFEPAITVKISEDGCSLPLDELLPKRLYDNHYGAYLQTERDLWYVAHGFLHPTPLGVALSTLKVRNGTCSYAQTLPLFYPLRDACEEGVLPERFYGSLILLRSMCVSGLEKRLEHLKL